MEGTALDFMKEHYNISAAKDKYLFYNLNKLRRAFEKEAEIDFIDMNNVGDFAETRPETLLMQDRQTAFLDSFVNNASKEVNPIGWYIVEQSIMHDNPPDLKQLSKKLGMSLERVEEHELNFNHINDIPSSVPEHERPKAKVEYYDQKTNILISAVMHHQETGFWPKATATGDVLYGPMRGTSWSKIDKNISRGLVKIDGITSLHTFLAPYKEIDGITVEDIIDSAPKYTEKSLHVSDIIKGAKEHFSETKKWPSCHDYTLISSGPLEGESWGTIDKHLRDGGRTLSGGTSLFKLLDKNGLSINISIESIIKAAEAQYKKEDKWPSTSDNREIKMGPLKGKSWKAIANGFYRGDFGLPTDITLPEILRAHNCYDSNKISSFDIVETAKLHKKQTGKWPSSKDSNIIQGGPLDGEKWTSIHTAIRDGHRGFEKGTHTGLSALLKEEGCFNRNIIKDDVIKSIEHYRHERPDQGPTNKTKGRINDGSILNGMSWSAVDKRKIEGMTLSQIIKEHDANSIQKLENLCSVEEFDI